MRRLPSHVWDSLALASSPCMHIKCDHFAFKKICVQTVNYMTMLLAIPFKTEGLTESYLRFPLDHSQTSLGDTSGQAGLVSVAAPDVSPRLHPRSDSSVHP